MYKLTEKQKKEFEFYKEIFGLPFATTGVLGSTVSIAIFNPLL